MEAANDDKYPLYDSAGAWDDDTDDIMDNVNITHKEYTDVVTNDTSTVQEIIQRSTSQNFRNLSSFLSGSKFITDKGDQNTNIICVSEKRTYNLPVNQVDKFFGLLDACRKDRIMLHYSERQETATVSHSGIMIDIDRFQKSKVRQFTSEHYESFCRSIADILVELINFDEIDKGFIYHIFLIIKPSVQPVEGRPDVYKDGFHVLIPELQITKGLKIYLIEQMLKTKVMDNVFDNIDHIEPPSKMLDRASARNPVHFVGNSKPGKPAYNIDEIYRVKHISNRNRAEIRPALELKNIFNGEVGLPHPVNICYELSLSFYSPIINGHPTWLRKLNVNYLPELETEIQLLVEKTHGDILSTDEITRAETSVSCLAGIDAEAEHIRELLRILDISYAEEYIKWFKVICAIAHTSTSYKQLAIEFSHRKPESWSQEAIDRVWNEAVGKKYGGTPVTKRSIMHWARESSPDRYADIEKKNYLQMLTRHAYENQGKIEHAMAAKICHAMIGGKFVSDQGVSDKTGRGGYCWYEFVMPGQAMRKGEIYKWRKELDPDNIHLYVADNMPKIYKQLIDEVKENKDSADNEPLTKYWTKMETNLRNSASNLGNNGYQNGLISQAQYRFRQRGFTEELDSYEDIIGVGNGVLRIGIEPVLIKGFHEYKVSKFTETDYIPFDPENTYIKTLMKAFSDIFIEPDVREFMLYHAATGLDYKESSCLLVLLVGGGQNGKSFFAKMVHNTLGNSYCGAGKPQLLTSTIERADSANSAQMQMKGKRWFYFDEFNKSETLNSARVKGIASPGWQSGRDLHQTQSNFKNTCNPIALSNYDFIIDTVDHGTWRRIYYYKNKVKFHANPDSTNKFEKREDGRFIREFANMPEYKSAMLSIMTHYYSMLLSKYNGDLKNVPVPTIARETQQFRNRQDAMNRFITQMIVKSPQAEPIGLSVLATRYIEWYNQNFRYSTQTCTDVSAQFENSSIAQSLKRERNNIVFMEGHRIKATPEEPLHPEETALHLEEPIEEITWKEQVDVVTPIRVPEIQEKYMVDLIRGEPKHIQKTITLIDNIKPVLPEIPIFPPASSQHRSLKKDNLDVIKVIDTLPIINKKEKLTSTIDNSIIELDEIDSDADELAEFMINE